MIQHDSIGPEFLDKSKGIFGDSINLLQVRLKILEFRYAQNTMEVLRKET